MGFSMNLILTAYFFDWLILLMQTAHCKQLGFTELFILQCSPHLMARRTWWFGFSLSVYSTQPPDKYYGTWNYLSGLFPHICINENAGQTWLLDNCEIRHL